MALTEIRVYDYIGTKKTIVIPLGDMKTVRMVCRHLYPRYEEEKYTIYYDEEPLSWDSTFEYLEKKYHLTSAKVLTFKFRYCTFQEAMKRLQREDYELKSLITAGELKAYSKGGQMIFKEADLEHLIQDQMDEPTLILTPDKLKGLRNEELEELESEEKRDSEEGISFQLGKEEDDDEDENTLLATSDSSISLPQISFGSESQEENELLREGSDSFETLEEVTDLDQVQLSSSKPSFSEKEGEEDDGIVSEIQDNEIESPPTNKILSKMLNEMEEVSSEWSSMETLNEPDVILSAAEEESEEQRQQTLMESDVSSGETMASTPLPPSPPSPASAIEPLPNSSPILSRGSSGGSGERSKAASSLSQEKKENETSEAILKRHARITYYNQMNPFQHYALKIDLTAQKLALKTQADLSQVGGQVQISKSTPQVEIIPSFPGCLMIPERLSVDMSSPDNTVEFWVTPLTEGEILSARVDFYHQGKRVTSIATPTRIVKTTVAKATLVAGILAPIFSTFFSAFNIELNDNLPPLFRLFSTFVGAEGWMSLANFGLLLFLVTITWGVFLYKTKQPRLAPSIEKEV